MLPPYPPSRPKPVRARHPARGLPALVLTALLGGTLTAGPAFAAGEASPSPSVQAPGTVGFTNTNTSTNTDSVGDVDDANMMRLVLNAERAKRIRAEAEAAVETLPEKIRKLERTILASPVYVRPTSGVVTQWYGSHPGVDIAPPYGTPIVAVHSGVVTFVGLQDGYGMHVEVAQADGFVTTYSHMSAFAVAVGQLVVAGQPLGAVGSTGWSTGPHLHFEVHLPNGDRTDPALWLRWHGIALTPEPGLEPEPIP